MKLRQLNRTRALNRFDMAGPSRVRLTQPLMGTVVSRRACGQAFAQLFELLPDLHVRLDRSSGVGNELFIEITLAGTFDGRPVS